MRKLIVLAVLAALVAAPAALAKERNITMIGADVAPKAGQPWTATRSRRRRDAGARHGADRADRNRAGRTV